MIDSDDQRLFDHSTCAETVLTWFGRMGGLTIIARPSEEPDVVSVVITNFQFAATFTVDATTFLNEINSVRSRYLGGLN